MIREVAPGGTSTSILSTPVKIARDLPLSAYPTEMPALAPMHCVSKEKRTKKTTKCESKEQRNGVVGRRAERPPLYVLIYTP